MANLDSVAVPTEEMENLNVNETQGSEAPQVNEEGIPYVTVDGKTYPPLADGKYDVVIMSTGLEECILAGLLAVRGKKVLQIDRNPYYGGQCASLNLKELYEKNNQVFDKASVEGKFGASRNFCVDLVPKFLMANGKLVKMLIQTGVTRYIDFNGIAGSYVFNSGKIYKLPVTPTEALTSSLVRFMQKPKLRSFADFVAKYKHPKRVAGTYSKEDFKKIIEAYYAMHNKEKLSELDDLLQRFESKREVLVSALEEKYGLPVFPDSYDVEFGPGPLGLIIEGAAVPGKREGPVKSVVRVQRFTKLPDGSTGPAEASKKILPGYFISKVNDQSMIGLEEKSVQAAIVQAPRPVTITFTKPAMVLDKSKLDLTKITMRELFKKYGLDADTANFIGHAMALHTDDSYLDRPAEETVVACQLYGQSVGRYGQDSPYLYPMYGLSSLPEGFSRLAAIYGGTVMLRTDVDEILKNSKGEAVGVRCGDQVATADIVIGDASFFPPEKSVKTGQVIRSVCLLKEKIKGTNGDSCQIILPAKHLPGKEHDIYISEISSSHSVSAKGTYIAIVSTTVETADPVSELNVATSLLGEIHARFDTVTDTYGPASDGKTDKCFVTKSLDATSHFESAAQDIMHIYHQIFDHDLNLDRKIVEES
mmetsp:Transcript_12401/g.16086  ORF Transcript_12401/g.16086 Transcript_12401/m.16086 type:complete len:648 (+) Transcript_12401:168-2111(+)